MTAEERDYRRRLRVYWKGQEHPSYFSFNNFEDLRNFETDGRTIVGAEIIARWPRDSIISHTSEEYVEVKDAKKLLKKMGVIQRTMLPAMKTEPSNEEPRGIKTSAEKSAGELAKRAEERKYWPDGVYIVMNKEALVRYNGVEFTMPLLRKGKLYTATMQLKEGYELKSSEFGGILRVSSHRFDEQNRLAMCGLDALLEKAEANEADLIVFAPSGSDSFTTGKVGAYTFLKYLKDEPKPKFHGYDIRTLKERLRATSPAA